jgi:hypothetical protein
MSNDFGTILSIVGFYFSLVSLLGSLFFIHLGNWYKDIGTTEQKWTRYKNVEMRERHIECYLEAFDEKSPLAWISFTLLTVFMIILGFFAENLRLTLPAGNSIAVFLYLPVYLFFSLYFVGSMLYIVLGYRKVRRLYREIDAKLSG